MPQTDETIFVTAELKIKTNIDREVAIEAIRRFVRDYARINRVAQALATYGQIKAIA